MSNLFFFTHVFSGFIANLFVWCFLMATLFNFVRMSGWQFKGVEKARFQEPMLLSLVIFISYLIGGIVDYFAHLKNFRAYLYPNGFYFLLDILTIIFIYLVIKVNTKQGVICKKYLLFGLSLNSLLFLVIQIDFALIYEGLRAREPWWFWYVFPVAINAIDALMVAVLILHKDFLKIHFLTNKLLFRLS